MTTSAARHGDAPGRGGAHRADEPAVRLVASDLDGTLLRPDATVSERTRAAIARTLAAGVEFVMVTGRPPRGVREIAARAGVGGLAICANGGLVYDLDAGAVVASTPLGTEAGRRLVRELRAAVPGTVFASETATGFLRGTGWLRPRVPEPDGAVPDDSSVDDPLALVAEPVVKLLVRNPELPFAELAARVRAAAGDDAVVTWSGPELLEVSAAGVTKAFALEWLCGRLGVEAREVVAIGDMQNDLTMLAWAGRSVAVANAAEEVLEAVDEVTAANVEDGVALVLERLVAEVSPARRARPASGAGRRGAGAAPRR
ncbi:MAG TPA: HAD family hydrolase [Actinomycetota bacterium]|nr:HAD family hydrolase [Actinomycetota bacterium]